MSRTRRMVLFLLVTAVSVAADQVTKIIATDTLKGRGMQSFVGDLFRLQYATNDGAFLSLGSQLPPALRFALLTLGVGVLLLALAFFAVFSKTIDATQVVGYALIVSGGGSNWFDRARFGGNVVDFMNIGLGTTIRSGIFNVADLAIIAGIVVLLLQGRKLEAAAKKQQPQQVP